MNSRTTSISVSRPQRNRRPSLTSRLSSAVSITDQGEGGDAPVVEQIEEEIAEIKRYEVRRPDPKRAPLPVATALLTPRPPATGLYNHRYAPTRVLPGARVQILTQNDQTGFRMLSGNSRAARHGGGRWPASSTAR